MRKPRRINIEDIPTTESNNKVIEMRVAYNIGGMNYFSSDIEPRGYVLMATPCEKGNGMTVYGAFTGIKILIEATERFSRKKLEEIASNIKNHEQYQELIQTVASKNNLTLQSTVAA